MSVKFSLVSLATIAVLASPLVASANTVTNQNTRNLGSTEYDYGMMDKQPISQNQTERDMYRTNEASPMNTSGGTLSDRNTGNSGSTETDYVIIDRQPTQNQANSRVNQRIVPNYVGVGGSNRGAALDSKIGLTNHLSFDR